MKQLTIEEIRIKALPILKKAAVTRSALFGSYSSGSMHADSDIDILVDLPEEKSLLDFVDLKLQLEDVLGKKVDLVEYDSIKPRLREYILGNQVQIL